MTTTRQPQGIPAGGQFAATAHAEPDGASLVGVRIGEPREMTRDELVITGQAVDGNPALSEVSRQIHHSRSNLAYANRVLDNALLNAAVLQAKNIFPGAKDLRLKEIRTSDFRGYVTPSSITTAEGESVSAEIHEGDRGGWAFHKVEGCDPADIYGAVSGISQFSDVWRDNPRCDYDLSTEEIVIYLDGRRRHES